MKYYNLRQYGIITTSFVYKFTEEALVLYHGKRFGTATQLYPR